MRTRSVLVRAAVLWWPGSLLFCAAILASSCADDADEREWREIKRGAYSYNDETAVKLVQHSQRFTKCVHLDAIHEFFWKRCDIDQKCGDYLRYYPDGSHIGEIESKYWDKCKSSGILCSAYIDAFPHGAHMEEAVALARQATVTAAVTRALHEDEKKRVPELCARQVIWRAV